MTFRVRLAIASAVAVAVAVAVASFVVFVEMRTDLRRNLDTSLRQNATSIAQQIQRRGGFAVRDLNEQQMFTPGGPDSARDYVQFVNSQGQTYLLASEIAKVPVSTPTLAVAAGTRDAFFSDLTVDGTRCRVYTIQVADGTALQLVRSLRDVNHTLHRLKLILLLVIAGGIAAGAAGGAIVSRAALVPVRRLTEAAERISETRDPSERVPEGDRDELSRLGSAFNTMLGALEEAIETQRRFVADASHELRTPLTSMQTNLDVLRQQDRLQASDRERLLDDLHREAHEMRDLIAGLLELARGEDPRLERRPVQLDELVESAVERARARFPQVAWKATLEPTTVEAVPERLERAIWNLLENAGKWSPDGQTVDVALERGELRVRDHGPGIAPEDRPLVFDRFYRSTAARSMPGSGLGLAIVREVAEAHGGAVSVEDAPGGGALLRLRLNGSAGSENGAAGSSS